MKNYIVILAIAFSTATYSQKEKVRGSKIVTTEEQQIGDFTGVEVSENLEIFLIKGDKCGIEIEADDNLHDAIDLSVHGNLLQISANKDVSGAKKFSVRVTYTSDLKSVSATGEASVTALTDISLTDFTLKASGSAKVFANIRGTNFIFSADDRSKSELNLISEKATITLSKNSQLKAFFSTPDLTFDMYQKSVAKIEGDAANIKLRLDNNSVFTGKNFDAKTAAITMEGYTSCSIAVTGKLTLDASGKAEIDLFGEQKIELKTFSDNAILRKKPTK